MTAISTALEYAAIREAIQKLSTLDADGKSRNIVSFTIGDVTFTYGANQLASLQAREETLARRLTIANARKRTTPDFTGG